MTRDRVVPPAVHDQRHRHNQNDYVPRHARPEPPDQRLPVQRPPDGDAGSRPGGRPHGKRPTTAGRGFPPPEPPTDDGNPAKRTGEFPRPPDDTGGFPLGDP